MAQTDTAKLDVDDLFPSMSIQVVDAAAPLELPTDLTAEYTIFLGYRGKW